MDFSLILCGEKNFYRTVIISRTKRRAKKRNLRKHYLYKMERCSIESIFSMLVPGRYKWYLYLMETGTYIAMRCHVLGYCREIISNILTRFLKTQSTKEKERFTHPRKDSIQYFFYFQAELHNKMVRLNIAQRIRVKDNGKRDFPLFYK